MTLLLRARDSVHGTKLSAGYLPSPQKKSSMGNDNVMDHTSPRPHILEPAEKLSKSYLNLTDPVPQNGVFFSTPECSTCPEV